MGVARVNFGDIMKAIEDKLVADDVINSDLILWAVNDEAPQISADRDVVLRAGRAVPIPADGGAWDFRYVRNVDVYVRSHAIRDTGGSHKSWVKDHFALMDTVLNSMITESPDYGHFWPSNGTDHLTTMPITVHSDLPPQRPSEQAGWGDSVCTLEIHYMPLLKPEGI